MKQVWILNHYALEPGGAGGTRHFQLAAGLPASGWQATVIAASVELNSGRQRLAAGEMRRRETHAGVPFVWIRTPQYEGNGGGRMHNMLAFALRVLLPRYTRGLPAPAAVIGSSVHPFAALAGALLARRYGVPFVFEVRDLWPQTLVDLGRLKERSLVTRALRRLERWLYRRARSIVVLLPHAFDYIGPLGVAQEKVVWIPNGVDLSAFPQPIQRVRKEGEPFVMMYFGAHAQANALDNVLRAMKRLCDLVPPGSVRLRIIGDGPLKPALIDMAAELGLRSVSFEPPVPKHAIPALAAEADAFVFNLADAPVFRYGISSNKLFEFMAGTRPVLFCCAAANNPVEEAGAGITVPPGKPEALAEAMLALMQMPEEQRHRMGYAGRWYVEQTHDFQRLAQQLAATLDKCVA